MSLKKSKIDLDKLSEDEILNLPMSKLPIAIQGTWIEDCVNQLYAELEAKGLLFRPECYLADEWLTPENETCIGIPFYLAHPALVRLEKRFMMEAEGESRDECMKLLRHEAGHAICYAYRFNKRQKWQRIFGPSTVEYRDTYKYRPYSKNYVKHLDGYYAQYHPDEDFVETFAVWLTPGIDWQSKYGRWKAIDKLKYVDRLMQEIKGKAPSRKSSVKYWRVSTLRYTLKTYYKRKRKFLEEEFPDFHDPFLWRVFQKKDDSDKKSVPAADLIRKNKIVIMNQIARFSGEKKYIVHHILKDVRRRAQELRLVCPEEEHQAVLSLTAYVTSLVMNYFYTGRFMGDKERKR